MKKPVFCTSKAVEFSEYTDVTIPFGVFAIRASVTISEPTGWPLLMGPPAPPTIMMPVVHDSIIISCVVHAQS